MDEQLLHYIWKYQKFNTHKLTLVDNQELKVFYPGNHNLDSGPDFEEAKIKISDLEWAGQIEIHVRSSDWLRHNHQKDPSYTNVVLHVVWEHDKDIMLGKEKLPTLELRYIVDTDIVNKYRQHMRSAEEIPCRNQLEQVPKITIHSMQDRVLVERLHEKASHILHLLGESKNDWEEVTYRTLSANFGFSTNKDAFQRLSEWMPYRKLKKVLSNPMHTEAVLFGMAGFLEDVNDEYQASLQKEYLFLKKKFELPSPMVRAQWKFGKLRPPNFPTVRLAQLAALLSRQPRLFHILTHTAPEKLKDILRPPLSAYWQMHHNFGQPSKKPQKAMGLPSIYVILINTVAPLLAAFSKYTGEQEYMDRAMALLEGLPAESNRITKKWDTIPQVSLKNACDSQAMIQLYKSYCQKRKCLHCNMGVAILNK